MMRSANVKSNTPDAGNSTAKAAEKKSTDEEVLSLEQENENLKQALWFAKKAFKKHHLGHLSAVIENIAKNGRLT
jgi:cell shape-determining protein MreC